jgi:hypothetical protein
MSCIDFIAVGLALIRPGINWEWVRNEHRVDNARVRFPFEGFAGLQVSVICRQMLEVLSCGSPGLRRAVRVL